MLSLIHLSDVHVDDNTPTANDVLLKRMENLIKFCDSHFTNPIYTFTGDMINNGNKAEFDVMRKKLIEEQGIFNRSLLTIGNHDVLDLGIETIGHDFHPEACLRFYHLQAELFSKNMHINQQYSLTTYSHTKKCFENTKQQKQSITISLPFEKTLIIILDSNMLDDYINNFARGELGSETMKFMNDAIKLVPEDWLKIVMLHHHPVFNNYFQLMCDSNEFIKNIWDVPNILIMFGHKHSYMLQSSHHGLISAADTTRREGQLKLNAFIIDTGKLTWQTFKVE